MYNVVMGSHSRGSGKWVVQIVLELVLGNPNVIVLLCSCSAGHCSPPPYLVPT